MEDNTIYVTIIEAKIVTPRVKHINITVCFIQEQYGNDLFIPKDEKYVIIPDDMCTKPCLGPNISRKNKMMNEVNMKIINSLSYKNLKLDNNITGSV